MDREQTQTHKEERERRVNLYCGDFRITEIEPDSVDLIFTDPPYLKKFVPLYGDLGKFAARVLKPGGSLVTYIGHYNLPDYLSFLAPHLTFWWICGVGLERPGFPMNHRHVVPKFKPLLWYVKGEYKGEYAYDFVDSKFQGKDLHEWQQSTVEADHFIERLTKKGDIVLDPFAGSGTTGITALRLKRRFIGIEINPGVFQVLAHRIHEELEQPITTQSELAFSSDD